MSRFSITLLPLTVYLRQSPGVCSAAYDKTNAIGALR
jgi:hypothetical protein